MDKENKKSGTIWSEALRILNEAGQKGIRVDVEGLKDYLTQICLELDQVKVKATSLTGIKKLNSPKEVRLWLDRLGVEGSGASKERLQMVIGKDRGGPVEAAELIMKVRGLQRLVSTGSGLLGRVSKNTDRLYYEWKPSEHTGRLYSNIQNYPGPLRDYFLPDEGELIIVMDWQSQELRILMQETGETELLKAMDEGEDFHTKIAGLMYPTGKVTEQQREGVKAITYGIPYGQLGYGLVYRWGISEKAALEILEKYHKIRPKLQPWINREVAKVRKQGFVETRAGQKRYNCPDNAIVNNRIQAEAADMLCGAIVRVADLLKKYAGRILATVHDSIVMSIPLIVLGEKILGMEARKISYLRAKMEGTERGRMPVNVEVGKTWGQCHRKMKEKNGDSD